jgi:hypothetical protein
MGFTFQLPPLVQRNGCFASSGAIWGPAVIPAVSLADARQKAGDAREMLARGEDPIEARKAAEAASKPQRTLTL